MKVKVKVTRSLTFVSIEKASKVEYAFEYEVPIFEGSKVIAKDKGDLRETDGQTDWTKQYVPDYSIRHEKVIKCFS